MTSPAEATGSLQDTPFRLLLFRRMVLEGQAKLAQLTFRAEVLERYRGQARFRIYRTDSAGKLQQRDGWYIDFGITDGDSRIHTSLANLDRVPPEEREYWLGFLVTQPLNEKFLKMQLGVHCSDDGEIRAW